MEDIAEELLLQKPEKKIGVWKASNGPTYLEIPLVIWAEQLTENTVQLGRQNL